MLRADGVKATDVSLLLVEAKADGVQLMDASLLPVALGGTQALAWVRWCGEISVLIGLGDPTVPEDTVSYEVISRKSTLCLSDTWQPCIIPA